MRIFVLTRTHNLCNGRNLLCSIIATYGSVSFGFDTKCRLDWKALFWY